MCRFLMAGAVTGGTLSKVFWKTGPTFQTPAVPFRIDRLDGPVVRADSERVRDRGGVRGDVRRAVRVVLVRVLEDERAERRVTRDGDEVLRCARDRRPAQHDRTGREAERLVL